MPDCDCDFACTPCDHCEWDCYGDFCGYDEDRDEEWKQQHGLGPDPDQASSESPG